MSYKYHNDIFYFQLYKCSILSKSSFSLVNEIYKVYASYTGNYTVCCTGFGRCDRSQLSTMKGGRNKCGSIGRPSHALWGQLTGANHPWVLVKDDHHGFTLLSAGIYDPL